MNVLALNLVPGNIGIVRIVVIANVVKVQDDQVVRRVVNATDLIVVDEALVEDVAVPVLVPNVDEIVLMTVHANVTEVIVQKEEVNEASAVVTEIAVEAVTKEMEVLMVVMISEVDPLAEAEVQAVKRKVRNAKPAVKDPNEAEAPTAKDQEVEVVQLLQEETEKNPPIERRQVRQTA